jgi:hypothetical protein
MLAPAAQPSAAHPRGRPATVADRRAPPVIPVLGSVSDRGGSSDSELASRACDCGPARQTFSPTPISTAAPVAHARVSQNPSPSSGLPSRATLAGRRFDSAPSPFSRRREALWEPRVKVRSTLVRLARDSTFLSTFPGSPDLSRRGCSPCTVAPRHRHPGSPPWSSSCTSRHTGAIPASFGAPQLDFVVAPPLAGVALPQLAPPPAASRRCSPALDRSRWIVDQRPRSRQAPGQSSPPTGQPSA